MKINKLNNLPVESGGHLYQHNIAIKTPTGGCKLVFKIYNSNNDAINTKNKLYDELVRTNATGNNALECTGYFNQKSYDYSLYYQYLVVSIAYQANDIIVNYATSAATLDFTKTGDYLLHLYDNIVPIL